MGLPLGEGTTLHKSDFERRVFHKLLAKAGLRRIKFHTLRHTFASRLLQNGESLLYVKEQMGHSSIQVTVDIYGHLVPGANRQAVNRLDDQGATIRNHGRSSLGLISGKCLKNLVSRPAVEPGTP